jgi:hypothetical protein
MSNALPLLRLHGIQTLSLSTHPENPSGGQPVLMCKWADKSQTLCTNPACSAKAKEEAD